MEDMQQHLVDTLEDHMEEGYRGFFAGLEAPGGRRPSPDLVERSQWYNALPAQDQEKVRDVVWDAMQSELFGILVALDGGDVISDVFREYDLQLIAKRGNEEVVLSSTAGNCTADLHDMFSFSPRPESGSL